MQTSLPLHQPTAGGRAQRNLLIAGDNLTAMRALSHTRTTSLDLIYIDPPYATGLSYYSQHRMGASGAAVQRRAYRDSGGAAAYLDFMYPRLAWMRELLGEQGKLFVHCDWRANAMLRLLLDELFGADCFRNEIIWRRAPNLGRQAASRQLGRVIDSILVYSKCPGTAFRGRLPRRRRELPLDGKGKPKGARWDPERRCFFTTAPRGDYTDESIAKLREQGRVFDAASGKVYIKYFLTPGEDGRWYKEQPIDALWDDPEVRPLRHRSKAEDMGYDTQKPEGLLERIITWASAPGDWVADFFCGSGTTPTVAARLGRRWIACDVGRAAVSITRRRLVSLAAGTAHAGEATPQPRSDAFELRSVQPTEQRAWAAAVPQSKARPAGADAVDADAAAVLESFGAEPTRGRFGQGREGTVWVAPSGAAVGPEEIDAACAEAAHTGAKALTILAWRWAASDWAREQQRDLRLCLRTIPEELYRGAGKKELRFAERPRIHLVALPAAQAGRWIVQLAGLHYPEPPTLKASASATPNRWVDLVDHWMVDFEGCPDCFRPDWIGVRASTGDALPLRAPAWRVGERGAVRVQIVTALADVIDGQVEVSAAKAACSP